VKLLIEKGTNINAEDEGGNTALHFAAANGKKDIAKFLLENGAKSDVTNSKEQKPIDYSNIKGFNEITELLVKNGASASTKPMAQAPVEPAKSVSGANDFEAKKKALLELKDLLDMGILTQDEFDGQKKKILEG
jgi:uncharacterized protein